MDDIATVLDDVTMFILAAVTGCKVCPCWGHYRSSWLIVYLCWC